MHFFEKIGIRIGHKILDFGCGNGNYTIPLSRAIGNGTVYAMDKNKQAIEGLKKKIFLLNIENIKIIYSKDSAKIPLGKRILDVVLFYDIFNPSYFTENGRKRILSEASRILKQGGLLSIFPQHAKLDELKEIAGRYGFLYEKQLKEMLVYDQKPSKGTIISFRKVDAFK